MVEAHVTNHYELPVCLGSENPNRLVSLLDIVKAFEASKLFAAIRAVKNVSELLVKDLPPQFRVHMTANLKSSLVTLADLCRDQELPMASLRSSQLANAVDTFRTLSPEGCEQAAENMASDIAVLLENELSLRQFFALSAERVAYYTQPFNGWEEVVKAFPDASDDIEEMNKCFAMGRYAAAIFHSLLVVEHGVVALGRALGVTDPKEGWDATCKKMEATLKAGHSVPIPSGLDFTFVEQVNVLIQAMKHAWRNKVNHAAGKLVVIRTGFGEEVAEEIITATRALMRTLAQGLCHDESE